MTYLEKVMEMNPEYSESRVLNGCNGCPCDYDLETKKESDAVCDFVSCRECWNREIFETPKDTPKTDEEGISIDDLKDTIGSLTSIALDVICDETERRRLDNAGIMIIDVLSELEKYRESNGIVSISNETRSHIDKLADGQNCESLNQKEALEVHHALYLMDAFNKSIQDSTLIKTLASLLLNSEFGHCYMCKNSTKNITLDGKNNGCDGLCNVDSDVTVEQFLTKLVREIEYNRNKEV